MVKPLLYSGFLHLTLVAILLVSAIGNIEPEAAPKTVRIRLRGRTGGIQRAHTAMTSPSGSLREIFSPPALPKQVWGQHDLGNNFPSESGKGLEPAELPAARTRESVLTTHPVFHPMPELDPLAGLESALPPEAKGTGPLSEAWTIVWDEGRERAVVKAPSIDRDAFLSVTEQLVDVMVMIEVSPQGDVVSALVEAPGSGDIRIDRYISGKALDFAFERIFDDEGTQVGYFRLIFEGGDR